PAPRAWRSADGRADSCSDLHDAIDEDARRHDDLGIECAERYDLFHLHDRHVRRHRHHWIEIPRRFAIDEIAPPIRLQRLDQREIALERLLKDIGLAVENPRLLALRQLGAGAGLGIEAGDARPGRSHALAHRALRDQLELDRFFGEGFLEAMGIAGARKRADQLADAAFLDELGEANFAGAAVIAHHGEIAGAGFEHALDQFDWLADRTEPGEQQRRTVLDAGDGGANVFDLLVDHAARPHAAWGFRTRSADAGYFASMVAGRSGRATRLPP